jgi:hypothetical protein
MGRTSVATSGGERKNEKPSSKDEKPRVPYRNMIGMIKIATMFATLIIGLMAGPAVSL